MGKLEVGEQIILFFFGSVHTWDSATIYGMSK